MKEKLIEFHKYVEESKGDESNICEITVIKNGEVEYEDYWHGYKPKNTLNIMSVTKSVVAILLGIQILSGIIASSRKMTLIDFANDHAICSNR